MFIIVWRYRVAIDNLDRFLTAYGPAGEWARLCGRAPGYRGSELWARTHEPGSFLVIDRWDSEQSFLGFRHTFQAESAALDQKYATLAVDETFLGNYVSAPILPGAAAGAGAARTV